jgi:hypothetical protein
MPVKDGTGGNVFLWSALNIADDTLVILVPQTVTPDIANLLAGKVNSFPTIRIWKPPATAPRRW